MVPVILCIDVKRGIGVVACIVGVPVGAAYGAVATVECIYVPLVVAIYGGVAVGNGVVQNKLKTS